MWVNNGNSRVQVWVFIALIIIFSILLYMGSFEYLALLD
jgi:hypothetical protein